MPRKKKKEVGKPEVKAKAKPTPIKEVPVEVPVEEEAVEVKEPKVLVPIEDKEVEINGKLYLETEDHLTGEKSLKPIE